MFDRAFKGVNTFVDHKTELVEESSKKAEEKVIEGSSKRAGTKLEQESDRKQKIDDDKDTAELQQKLEILKRNIKIRKGLLGLKAFMKSLLLRENVETLWKLVKAKHESTRPERDYERVLWGDLKVMFDPHVEDEALCYPKNDHEDIKKLGAKGNIGFFIGYFADSYAYRVYYQRTRKLMETMNVIFNEILAMAFEQSSSKHGLQGMTSRQISSGLDLTYVSSTIITQKLTEGELDLLFEAMYDDYISGQPSAAPRTTPAAQAPLVRQTPMVSTTIANTALIPTNSSYQATNIPNTSQDVDGLETQQQHAQQPENQASL
nr:hypothetical protein [Tanacetum cinerariifolium]